MAEVDVFALKPTSLFEPRRLPGLLNLHQPIGFEDSRPRNDDRISTALPTSRNPRPDFMSHMRHEIGTWGRIYIIDNWTGSARSCAPMHTPWSRDCRTHHWLVAILTAVFIGATACQTAEAPPGRWLVVAAPALRAELTPLIDHRRAEGFQVTLLESTALLTPEQIQQTNAAPLQSHIRDFAMQTNSPCYVLLVGLPASPDPATAEGNVVPALFGTIERMKGQLTDYLFAPTARTWAAAGRRRTVPGTNGRRDRADGSQDLAAGDATSTRGLG